MDQTESNNSRGITTLAHGNRSYSRGDGGCETWDRKDEMGEGGRERERRRERSPEFRKVVARLEEGGRLAAFFFAAQRRRRYFVVLDPNVENGSAGCIRISRYSGIGRRMWPGDTERRYGERETRNSQAPIPPYTRRHVDNINRSRRSQ